MPTYPQRSLAAQRAVRERRTFRTRGNLSARPGYSADVNAGRIHPWFRDALRTALADGEAIAYTVFSYSTPIAAYVTRADVDAGRWIVDTFAHSQSSSAALGTVRTGLGGYSWEASRLGLGWEAIEYVDAAAHVHAFNALTPPQARALVAIATGNPAADKPHPRVIANLVEKGLVQWHAFHEIKPEWARKLVVTADAARILRACGFTVNSNQEA